MFRKILFLAAVSVTLIAIAETSYALDVRRERIGLGVVVGEPTGVSAKYWLDRDTAVAGAASWSLIGNSVGVHGDYLYHFHDIIKTRDFTIPLYVGAGGRVKSSFIGGGFPFAAGVRIPLGATYLFPRDPIDIFLEVVPGVELFPNTAPSIEGGIGIRFYFRP